jgi:SulP family sulfate permease
MKRPAPADDISFFSFKKDLYGYRKETLIADAYAAMTVAMLTVPQAMAYAMLAGLPISCGIFAAIYSALIASLFGSSKHLVIGPSNAIAILVQAGIAEIIFTYYRDINPAEREILALQLLTTLTLLIGFFQILAAGLKLGRLSQFISHSVVVGYIVGTTIAVFINQFFTLLGIPRMPGVHSLYERGVYLISNISQFHLPTAIVGFFSLVLIITLKRANKRLPAAFITIVLAGIFIHIANLLLNLLSENFFSFSFQATNALQTIALVGDNGVFSDVVPKVSLPSFDMSDMNALLPTAFAIALLSIMETSSAAKSIAANSGQRLSNNQEIFGIGLGNLVSSLVSGMPVAGSPSRSAINYHSGAETRVSAILNVLFVMAILIVFNYFIALIPLAALAALLLTTSVAVVNKNQFLLCLKATRSDALVLAVTIMSCIFFSFDIAFYIGVGISITLYLKKAAIPQLVEFEVDEDGELKNIHYCKTQHHRSIRVIKVEGELFFGAADLFQSTLKAIAEDDTHTKVIILQLKNARDIDATACLALLQLHNYLKGSGRYLLACGITEPIWDVLNDSGLIDKLGKNNLFAFDEERPHHYMQKAIQRAKELEKGVIVEEEPAPAIIQEEIELIEPALE